MNEYPSAVALDNGRWLLSDGAGRLYVVRGDHNPNQGGTLLASFEISSGHDADGNASGDMLPSTLRAVASTSQQFVDVVLSTKVTLAAAPDSSTSRVKSRTRVAFDLFAVTLNLSSATIGTTSALPVSPRWKLRGDDLPIFASYESRPDHYLFAAGSSYAPHGIPLPVPPFEPSPDELAPIPRVGEALDDSPPVAEPPPPYSWSQTTDSVTVAFPIPSSTPKAAIKVMLAAKHLTVSITGSTAPSSFPLPRYTAKQFWDGIDSSASFWTFDREGEKAKEGEAHSVGLLTLHMEKSHDGTKWPHVFASLGTGTGLDEDREVSETVDPLELWLIRESLEKYTASLASGEDASGLGLGKGMPSLADGEMDDEVDAQVGSRVVFSRVSRETGTLVETTSMPADVLSTPLPASIAETRAPTSLVIKNGIDGLLYTYSDNADWAHSSTYSALAFVLASKRDTRFTFHRGSDLVLAFESGSATTSGANVYIYRGAGSTAKWAKQAVLKITTDQSGALLGVGVIGSNIVCLCEKELVVLRGVI